MITCHDSTLTYLCKLTKLQMITFFTTQASDWSQETFALKQMQVVYVSSSKDSLSTGSESKKEEEEVEKGETFSDWEGNYSMPTLKQDKEA